MNNGKLYGSADDSSGGQETENFNALKYYQESIIKEYVSIYQC